MESYLDYFIYFILFGLLTDLSKASDCPSQEILLIKHVSILVFLHQKSYTATEKSRKEGSKINSRK